MKNSFFIIFIVFVFGVFKNTKSVDYVVNENHNTSYSIVSESEKDDFHQNHKKSKHSNLVPPFLESIAISNQLRGFGLDFCYDVQFSSFNFFSTYLYKLFTSIAMDVRITSIPLFKLYNNYRI